jgi:hypothetical protein
VVATEPGQSVLAIAVAERDHTARLFNDHKRGCPWLAERGHHGCPECLSLARHLDRCNAQVEVLTAEPADEPVMW